MNLMYLRKESSSDVFNFNYVIPYMTQLDLEFAYRFKNGGRFIFGYTTDVRANDVKTLDDSTVSTRHLEVRALYGKKFRTDPESFHSLKYSLYGGVFHKSFNPGDKSVLFYGQDVTGWMLQSDLLMDQFFPKILDLKLSATVAGSVDLTSQVYRLKFETYAWLNNMGDLMAKDPIFVYYDRYKGFHDFKVITGISVENSHLETSGFTSNKTNDWFYALTFGVEYAF